MLRTSHPFTLCILLPAMKSTLKTLILPLLVVLAITPAARGQQNVTFLHGIGGSPGQWSKAEQEMKRTFKFNSRREGYNSSIAIPTIAQQERNNILPSSVVVGHSMGGLVAREMVRQYGTSRVKALITAGTPHQGAQVVNEMRDGTLEYAVNLWSSDLAEGWYFMGGLLGNGLGSIIRAAGVYGAEQVGNLYNNPGGDDLKVGSSFIRSINSSPQRTLPSAHYTIYGAEDAYELPRLAGSFVNSGYMEGRAFEAYASVATLYGAMAGLTGWLGSYYQNLYRETGYYEYSAIAYFYRRAASGFARGFYSLVVWMPQEWWWIIGTTGTSKVNDGIVPLASAAPNFVNSTRHLRAPSTLTTWSCSAHPEAMNAP